MINESNIAFIDGQNLYYGTRENNWKIDFRKFRKYLKDKYHVSEAYYFFGYIDENEQALYTNLQRDIQRKGGLRHKHLSGPFSSGY